jgi:hypothetical protein
MSKEEGAGGDHRVRMGGKILEDHTFSLPLLTCRFDELFPEGSPVLLSETSVHSIAQPVLSLTAGSFLYK